MSHEKREFWTIPGTGIFSINDDFITTEEEYIIETVTFANYIIDIILNKDRVFVGIEQIKINKNFYDYKDLINLEKKIRISYPEESDE